MRFLITGAAGLIGSALRDKLLADGHSLVCLSRSSHDNQRNLRWIKHDLARDRWTNLPYLEIDAVVHLAGQTSAYSARKDPINDANVNVLGTLNLLEYLKTLTPTPFAVFSGTATVVGLNGTLPINENTPLNPITFYDISKFSAEMYLMQYIREGWIKGCSLRIANVYGRSSAGQQFDRGILDRVYRQASLGITTNIYGEGNFIRDYIFIDDVISAMLAAIDKSEQTNGQIFYIGSGEGLKIKDAFKKIIELANNQSQIVANVEYIEPPSDLLDIESRNAIIDSTAFRNATGWMPKHDFDKGIKAAYSMPCSNS